METTNEQRHWNKYNFSGANIGLCIRPQTMNYSEIASILVILL